VGFLREGIAFTENLHGSFVLAIVSEQRLYLVRDASGLRTIYYALQNGVFSFAVETKGICAVPGFRPELNPAGVFQYLTYSFVPLAGTMLRDVHELPAGHQLLFEPATGQMSPHNYFPLAPIPKHPDTSEAYWTGRLRQEIDEDIAQKIAGHEEVGVFLSGGLDSSIIAARVAQLHHRPIHTFSINFGTKYPHENAFAQLVAQRYRTIHHEVTVNPRDFNRRLPEIIRALDEPSGDPITAPNFELARFARGKVSCIFNGEGGDPCFGGPKNMSMLLSEWYGLEQPTGYREKAYLATYRRGYQHLDRLLAPELLQQLDEGAHLESLLTPFFAAPDRSFLDKLMAINIKLKGAHLILPKVERMLGAQDFVPYAPLFSRKIITSSMAMPTTLKLLQGVEKYILKRAYACDVPEPIIQRPKSGMRVPVRYWFQGELRRTAKRVLQPKNVAAAGLFQPATIKELLRYDKDVGLDRHGLLLWMILTLELWRRDFLE